MKKFLAILLAMVLLVSLVACGTSEAPAPSPQPPATPPAGDAGTEEPSDASTDTWNLRLGTIWNEETPFAAGANAFAQAAYDLSGGRIVVDVFHNSVLGSQADQMANMPLGTVDMMFGDVSTYTVLDGAAAFNIFSAPFLWENFAEMAAFLETDTVAQWQEASAQETGVRQLFAGGEADSRQLTANRPIQNADDFDGLIIRTAQISLVQMTMQRLGAQPTVIPLADLYMALRLGTADAQENGFIGTRNNSFYEVQSYVMRTNYIRDAYAVYIAERIWEQMNDYDRAILIEAAQVGTQAAETMTLENVEVALAYLMEHMTFVEVDIPSIQAQLEGLLFDFDGDIWPVGTYQVVRDFLTELRG